MTYRKKRNHIIPQLMSPAPYTAITTYNPVTTKAVTVKTRKVMLVNTQETNTICGEGRKV
jgi:hypothetical protein